MPQQLRDDECRRLAKDFLRRAESAPTKQEREDFLDMARAIERAAAKVKLLGDNEDMGTSKNSSRQVSTNLTR
jgi:hypothetical protein